MGFNGLYYGYPLVNVYKKLWKIHPLLIGKSTNSMGHFQWLCKRLPEGKTTNVVIIKDFS